MIFEDPTRQRWQLARVLFVVMCLLGLLLALDLTYGLISAPPLPRLQPSQTPGRAIKQLIDVEGSVPAPTTLTSAPRLTPPDFHQPFLTTAFVVQDDEHSLRSLKRNLRHLDIVFPNYYFCPGDDGEIVDHVLPATQRILGGALTTGGRRPLLFPILSNNDEQGTWHPEETARLLDDPEAQHTLITGLLTRLKSEGTQGLNVDFEQLTQVDRERYVNFLEDLTRELHQAGLYVTVDVPLNDEAFDYEAIGKIVDAVVLMEYDEHYETGKPGPVASQNWFREGLDAICERVDKSKLIIALGAYGYDWNTTPGNKKPAEPVSFADAVQLAENSGADIATVGDSMNPRFHYLDDQKQTHEVWLLDAVTIWNQYALVRQHQVRGVSLWRLGLEDASIWEFYPTGLAAGYRPAQLAVVPSGLFVAVDGDGELLHVTQLPEDGRRELTFDGPLVDYAVYQKLPRYCSVRKFGKLPAAFGRLLALTFDDGPDPQYTPQILDVLKKHHVLAAFFVIGDQVQKYPNLAAREVAEGHLLGNHTFFHPNIQDIPELRLKLELNSTQRAIESATGRQTLLFRAPYDTDSTPTLPRELTPLHGVNQLGYITVAADIDAADYLRLGVPRIVEAVRTGAQSSGGNIIVMHDAGGDRSQTVAALDRLIPELQAEGYRFVALSELAGVAPEALMPPVPVFERLLMVGSNALSVVRVWGWVILVILFFLTTIISILRIVFLGYFVFHSRRVQLWRTRRRSGFTPPAAVLVPAFNEEKVIGRTIDGLLASDYPPDRLRIVIIDDGSTDDTARIVQEYAARHSNVELLRKNNAGKSAALNLGMREVEEEYVITIDGDTIVRPETVRRLLEPFADPEVDAVCGNVQVGNVKNILTAFQDVEYVTSQNYDRRAFDALNCIAVVPGATGAWRRTAVLAAGGYSSSTLTEDADLTLTMLEQHKRIVYAPEARSITEAPERVGPLFQQRFRWSFGTLQCLWKHRHSFGRRGLGLVALPNMLIFQVIFPVLSPIGDLVLILSLLRGDARAILTGYCLFLAMDLTGSMIAFALDRRSFWGIWVVLVQRFYYRQFMYVVTFKTLLAALRGRRHGWNKLERQATVAGCGV